MRLSACQCCSADPYFHTDDLGSEWLHHPCYYSSSHNWNTLFLGANAVAEVMSKKYGIDKGDLLDAESSQSLGVRLALGETEVVAETRDFLIENGVSLDSFSQVGARCHMVITCWSASWSVGFYDKGYSPL